PMKFWPVIVTVWPLGSGVALEMTTGPGCARSEPAASNTMTSIPSATRLRGLIVAPRRAARLAALVVSQIHREPCGRRGQAGTLGAGHQIALHRRRPLVESLFGEGPRQRLAEIGRAAARDQLLDERHRPLAVPDPIIGRARQQPRERVTERAFLGTPLLFAFKDVTRLDVSLQSCERH